MIDTQSQAEAFARIVLSKFNWDEIFRDAHLNSGSPEGRSPASLCIQNVKPSHETAVNTFQRDKKEILLAAHRYGYKQLNETGKVISFVHPEKRGVRFQ